MSDPVPDPDPVPAYASKLKLWALGALAAVLWLVAGALINRWIGPSPSLPSPPPPPPGASGVVVVCLPAQNQGQ